MTFQMYSEDTIRNAVFGAYFVFIFPNINFKYNNWKQEYHLILFYYSVFGICVLF